MSGDETRLTHRYRTLKRARLYFDLNGFRSLLGSIRNLSEHGALLTLDQQIHLSNVRAIYLINENLMVPAELRWQQDDGVGVEFVHALDHFQKPRFSFDVQDFGDPSRHARMSEAARDDRLLEMEYYRFFSVHVQPPGRG